MASSSELAARLQTCQNLDSGIVIVLDIYQDYCQDLRTHFPIFGLIYDEENNLTSGTCSGQQGNGLRIKANVQWK